MANHFTSYAPADSRPPEIQHRRDSLLMPRHGNTQAGNYPTECPSCHSHEFRMHHGRWVCSFCRSSA